MKQFPKMKGASFTVKSTKRLQNACRELNKFLNCIMGSGTLDCKTSSTRNSSWNKWSCKIMCSVVRSYAHWSVVRSSNNGLCGACFVTNSWENYGREKPFTSNMQINVIFHFQSTLFTQMQESCNLGHAPQIKISAKRKFICANPRCPPPTPR